MERTVLEERENKTGSGMTEREFLISIIPQIAELIVYLENLTVSEREDIKAEMLRACDNRPDAYRTMNNMWLIIEAQLENICE